MVQPLGALLILNLPSKSVTVPFAVPFITTDAPIIGSPFWSTTKPLQTLSYCCTLTLFALAFANKGQITAVPAYKHRAATNLVLTFLIN